MNASSAIWLSDFFDAPGEELSSLAPVGRSLAELLAYAHLLREHVREAEEAEDPADAEQRHSAAELQHLNARLVHRGEQARADRRRIGVEPVDEHHHVELGRQTLDPVERPVGEAHHAHR